MNKTEHEHVNEDGILIKCYHQCKSVLDWRFFLGVTVSFPFEHFLYEKVWPFNLITHWMGL